MALILDTGALIGIDRGVPRVQGFLRAAYADGRSVLTTSAAVAQAWRGGPRQARLALLLRGLDERALDPPTARRIGALLSRSGTSDVVDAAVVDLSSDGDEILSSDPADIHHLLAVSGKRVTVAPV